MNAVSARGQIAVALVGLFTSWVAVWAWSEVSSTDDYMGTVFGIGLVIICIGIAVRTLQVPRLAVIALQAVAAIALCFRTISGQWWPTAEARAAFTDAIRTAGEAAQTYAPPVPGDAIGPLLLLTGAGCVLVVDVIAATFRRAALAGIPLLAVVTIATAVLGDGVGLIHFTVITLGYLGMLAVAKNAEVSAWASASDTSRMGAAGRGSTWLVGVGAIATAVMVAPHVPSASVTMFGGNGSGGDGDGITLTNPVVDLQNSLNRSEDQPLVQITTLDPSPRYLRIALLTKLNSMTWTSGGRAVPEDNQASGPMPLTSGLDPDLLLRPMQYDVTVLEGFESTWLPTYPELVSIDAEGDWRYDTSTMDFTAAGEQNTAGLSYTLQASTVMHDYDDLTAAGGSGSIDSSYLDLSESIDPAVGELTRSVTAGADTAFQKAVALQDWFRGGDFVYDTSVELTGDDALLRFLTAPVSEGGHTGFCQQYASAFALMARQLGIASRVAVGFLAPDRVADNTFEFSSHDLHSWPELYFDRYGWVAFEPTPGVRAPSAPTYTRQVGSTGGGPDPEATQSPSSAETPEAEPSRDPAQNQERPGAAAAASAADSGNPALWVGAFALVALSALIAWLPRMVRSRRRASRRHDDAEAVWAELRDTCVDLGITWPPERSPRHTAAQVQVNLSTDSQREALRDITYATERARYASRSVTVDLSEQLALVCAGLYQNRASAGAWRVRWLPKSVIGARHGARGASLAHEDELVG